MGSVWVCAHKFAKTQTVPDKTCGVILWVKKAICLHKLFQVQ